MRIKFNVLKKLYFTGLENKLEFQLALRKSSSQVILALGKS